MNQLPVKLSLEEATTARVGRFPISGIVISGIAVILDSIAIVGSGWILYWWLSGGNPDTFGTYAVCICSIWISTMLLFQFSDLYKFNAIIRPVPNIDKVAIAFGTGFLFLLAAAFSVKLSSTISRAWLGSFGIASFALTITFRIILSRSALQMAHRGVFSRNVIIVGTEPLMTRLLDKILKMHADFVAVTALFVEAPGRKTMIGKHPILGGLEDISAYVRSSRVDDVVIALPWSAEAQILSLVEQLRELPINVYIGADLIGLRLDFTELPGHFAKAPLFSVVGQPMSGWGVAIKAAEDYLLGAFILAAAIVPMAIIALLVRLDSPGPILFQQRRYGFNNKAFWIYKFRTMRVELNSGEKTIQATRSDPRVTRIGRLLRRTSLDELPQLFNVLGGTMSLVGPRPHAVDHNEEYGRKIRGYFARHRVKPGITGWAQVNGLRGETRDPERMAERVRHDVYYAENWSFLFDLRILAQTLFVIIWARNAY